MTDIFSSPRTMVAGANEDITQLDAAFQKFFDSKPYEQVVARYPHLGRDFQRLRFQKIPVILSRNVARICTDLRSALDQTGYACAEAAKSRRLKKTYFPFGASESHLADVIGGRCKDLPKEIVAVFRSFKPYRGGDDLLWAINEVANGLKHRAIKPVVHGLGAAILREFKTEDVGTFQLGPSWLGGKYEVELGSTPIGATPTYEFELGFRVAFGDIPIVGGRDVVTTLRAMSAKISPIIDATEAEARRIRLIP